MKKEHKIWHFSYLPEIKQSVRNHQDPSEEKDEKQSKIMLMLSTDEATQQEKKFQLHRQEPEWTFFRRKYTGGQ